jgi:hypothetical protein
LSELKTSVDPARVYAVIADIISRRENVKVTIKSIKKVNLKTA